MRAATLAVAAAGLSGCVQVSVYTPTSADPASLAAAIVSSDRVNVADAGRARGPLAVCPVSGPPTEVWDARIDADRLCGMFIDRLPEASGSEERCLHLREISTVDVVSTRTQSAFSPLPTPTRCGSPS